MKSKRLLPDDLLKLEKLLVSIDISSPAYQALDTYERAHLSCNRLFGNSQNIEVLAVLTKSWMKYLEYIVFHSKADAIKDIYNFDEGIKYLTKKKQIADIVKKPEHANFLACLILYRVSFTSKGYEHKSKFHVGAALSQWLNQTISKSTINSLESTVATLYGPGAWSLYRSDVDNDAQMPRHLFHMGLPIVKSHHADDASLSLDLGMPEDLAI